MKKSLFIFLSITTVILICSSCHKTLPYSLLIFRENKIDVINGVRFDGKIKNSLEEGKWTIVNQNNNLLQEGYFSNGFKIGEWNYKVNGYPEITIDWMKYVQEKDGIKLSIPSNWNVIEHDKATLMTTFESPSEKKEDKYFALIVQSKDKIQQDLKSYIESYDSFVFHDNNVVKLARYIIENGDTFYYANYVIDKSGEEMLVNTFIGENDQFIFDFTYSALNKNHIKKELTFLEIMRSVEINGERFFTPFNEITRFERINKLSSIVTF